LGDGGSLFAERIFGDGGSLFAERIFGDEGSLLASRCADGDCTVDEVRFRDSGGDVGVGICTGFICRPPFKSLCSRSVNGIAFCTGVALARDFGCVILRG